MKFLPSLTVLAVVALLAVPVTTQQPTFKSGARTVAVYATIQDRDGRLIPDLTREQFEVRDNGKPQPITVFSNEIQPISVIVNWTPPDR